jgi:hypothetical protein
MPEKVQTLTITNFTGRLTRILNGDINSGFAKFNTSWGYDPFSKPMNLTWNYQTSSIATVGSLITAMPLAGIKKSNPYFFLLDQSGNYYWMKNSSSAWVNGNISFNPLDDAVISVVGGFSVLGGTWNYGAGIENFSGDVVVSSDTNIIWINGATTVGSASSVLGTVGSVVTAPHPLKEFQGKLYYGNGNNIGEIINVGTFGTVTTGSKLSPALPEGATVTDLDVTPEGDYLLITASFASPTYLGFPSLAWTSAGDFQNYAAKSFVFYWNGSDEGATASKALPSFPATALSTFLDKQYTTIQDAFGMALMEGNKKLVTLPNSYNPFANSLSPNGTFLTWVSTEGMANSLDGSTSNNQYSSTFASLYYFGQLDEENPPGLWRMTRISPATPSTYLMQYAPFNQVINNYSFYGNEVWGVGKHFIGTQDARKSSYSSVIGRLHRFTLNPSQDTSPALGTYETQTQLFSKRISVAQIRVYCEPTIAGNAFQLDLIGANTNNFGNGIPIEDGTYTYTFGDLTDPQSGSTSVERINFPGNIKTQYSLGIRITNTGTTQMTIKKVEIDYTEEGK